MNMGDNMNKIETVSDFKKFLKDNREAVLEKTTKIEDLPPDDDWVMDNEWDNIYQQEVLGNVKLKYW